MVKPGIRSTEFWTSLATSVGGLLALFGIGVPAEAVEPIVQGAGALTAAGAQIGYALSRGNAKRGSG